MIVESCMETQSYKVHKISFQTFFVCALLLIPHSKKTLVPFEVTSPGYNALVAPFQQLLQGPMEVLLCERVNDFRYSLWAKGISKNHSYQDLDNREAEGLSWWPYWSNSLWQWWSCGLVHCPAGNATDPIWRVLASSNGISRWTPLKSQHSNPNPNPLANQLWCIDFLTPPTPHIIPHRHRAFLLISYPAQKLMLDSCKMVEKQSEAFHSFLWHFFQV